MEVFLGSGIFFFGAGVLGFTNSCFGTSSDLDSLAEALLLSILDLRRVVIKQNNDRLVINDRYGLVYKLN